MARFGSGPTEVILHYTGTIKYSNKEKLAAAGCLIVCAFSIWIALLSYRYARFATHYLGTPPHALHRGSEDCVVIFDGDSLTAGDGLQSEAQTYPFKAMAASGHACTWRNVAVSGAFTRDLLENQAGVLASAPLSHGPKIYVLWVGTNDLMYTEESAGDVWERVQTAARNASRKNWTLVVGTVTPRIQALRPDREIERFFADFFNSHSFESRRVAFSNLVRENAKSEDFRIIDFAARPEIGRADSLKSDYYLSDRTHFSPSGADVLARVTQPVITALLAAL